MPDRRPVATSRLGRAVVAMVATVGSIACGGCQSSPDAGVLTATGMSPEPVVLDGAFSEAYFGDILRAETTIMLSDVPADALLDETVTEAQVVHIELLWVPKPGATPIDSSATNATIRYILIVDDEIGVYEGGGMVRPDGDGMDGDRVKVLVLDATLRLVDRTPGFRDLLTPARLKGTITADHDDKATRKLYFAISQYVTDALDRSIFVRR